MKKIAKFKDFISNNKKVIIYLCISILFYYVFQVFAYISESIYFDRLVNCLDVECNTSNSLNIFDILKYITFPLSILMPIIYTRLLFIKNFISHTKDDLVSKLYKLSFLPYKITLAFAIFFFIVGDNSAGFIQLGRIEISIAVVLLLLYWFLPVYIIAITYQVMYKRNIKSTIKKEV